jgi:hypothetical protein
MKILSCALPLQSLYDWRFTANQFVLASSPFKLTTGDFFATELLMVLVIQPRVASQRKRHLQQSFCSCVFIRCVEVAHFFDDVVCLLSHCLATDDVSCKAVL